MEKSDLNKVIHKVLGKDFDTKNWAKEYNILKSLVRKGYCDLNFWLQFEPGIRINSFLDLYKENCGLLDLHYRFYLTEKQKRDFSAFCFKYDLISD